MTQLPTRFQNHQTRRAVAEAAATGLGSASPPYVSIKGGSFTLIDANGEREPIEGPLDVPDYSRNRSDDGSWQVRDRKWSSRLIAFARPNLAPVAPSLLGTLQRHGLVVQNDNTAEAIERYARAFEDRFGAQIGQQGRAGATRLSGPPRVPNPAGLVPEPTWSPTELGEQVYLRFRDAGTALDNVWSSGPAEQQRN